MFVFWHNVYFRTVSGHDCSNELTGTGKTGTGLRGIRGPKVELQPHPAQISYYQVTLYTRAVNTSNMSWPWRTWDWFEEYQDILFFNGQSEERFQEGKLHFVGGHRYIINQMSRLWQGGKHPRIMHHQGINSRCPFCFTYPILKHTTDLDHFLCNMHKLTNDWEADLFYSGHILSRLFHCIQRWGMWRWTQMHYGQGLSLWSRELYKVQWQPFMLCYVFTTIVRDYTGVIHFTC